MLVEENSFVERLDVKQDTVAIRTTYARTTYPAMPVLIGKARKLSMLIMLCLQYEDLLGIHSLDSNDLAAKANDIELHPSWPWSRLCDLGRTPAKRFCVAGVGL